MSKLAVITGGNSGIGEACAWRFAREGYEVVVCGRRGERTVECATAFARPAGWPMAMLSTCVMLAS